MRRTVRLQFVNEYLTSLRSLLRSEHRNMVSFWKMFKDQESDNLLPFPVSEISRSLPVDPLPVDEAIQRLFRSAVFKACREPLTREELLVGIANIQERTPADQINYQLSFMSYFCITITFSHWGSHVSTTRCVMVRYHPKGLDLSKLVTIPKKGKSVSLVDLRPISSMCGRLVSYVSHAVHQSSFTGGKSCSEGLLGYAAAVKTSLSKNEYCTAVFLDLKAAFDTVNHGALFDHSMVPLLKRGPSVG